MKMFYSAFIESVISFCVICWYGNLAIKNKNSLGSIVRVASKVAGVKFRSLDVIFKEQVLKKAKSIRTDNTHPLHHKYKFLPSGLRLAVPPASKNRYKFSFVPLSIGALNAAERRR
ncbi:gastrula zinc finger protein XlCGF28.1-like%2C partial [Xyrichtys novacula]|uniref:Gastrula zinc finger protein XlCGF28.1-like, partial n=1 Tax=Xyrichtys novacula TaxID=13765 RepID=A0AAV1FXR2_XYRNO|nr:gastrula zinc finger protein XlCGF28.1-like%2C partial [Xyrichtys novacula]